MREKIFYVRKADDKKIGFGCPIAHSKEGVLLGPLVFAVNTLCALFTTGRMNLVTRVFGSSWSSFLDKDAYDLLL